MCKGAFLTLWPGSPKVGNRCRAQKTLFCALPFTNPLKDKMDKMTDPACEGLKKYTYAEHRCRFEKWAKKWGKSWDTKEELSGLAMRAAARGVSGATDANAKCILKATDFFELADKGAEGLPDPEDFDAQHRAWCKQVSKKAKSFGIEDWLYGRSAKLINVFLKGVMLCKHEALPDGKEKAKWYAVHPPIDSDVLEGMKNAGIGNNIWAWLQAETKSSQGYSSWTKYKYEHYQQVICMIRCNLLECGETSPLPLWKNERFFKPVVHPECR